MAVSCSALVSFITSDSASHGRAQATTPFAYLPSREVRGRSFRINCSDASCSRGGQAAYKVLRVNPFETVDKIKAVYAKRQKDAEKRVGRAALSQVSSMGSVTLHNLACSQSRGARGMHVSAEMKELTGAVTNVEGLRFAMVVGRFNEFVTRPLVAGALGAFKTHSVKESDIDIVWVPGSFEIPIVAQTLAKTGKYHAVLCIGTVIRGETTHYDAVANSAASGVLSAGLNSGVPCIFGVLTCETLEQALHRAGGKAGNKGAEAAVTAIEMASLFQHHLNKL